MRNSILNTICPWRPLWMNGCCCHFTFFRITIMGWHFGWYWVHSSGNSVWQGGNSKFETSVGCAVASSSSVEDALEVLLKQWLWAIWVTCELYRVMHRILKRDLWWSGWISFLILDIRTTFKNTIPYGVWIYRSFLCCFIVQISVVLQINSKATLLQKAAFVGIVSEL